MAEEQRWVMILGAGLMQLPALHSARDRGWKIIVADADPQAPGVELADIFEAVDLKDREKLRERAVFHRDRGGLDGVFTAGTDFSTSVAYVAQGLGLPGISFETALKATHKGLMRQAFRERGIPSPDFQTFTREDIHRVSHRDWNFPLVVKPVDNMGARGVEKVGNPRDLREKAEKALGYSRSGTLIVEEFVSGSEYSLDALVYRGKVRICGIADRHIFFPPFFVELGHTMPSRGDRAVLKALEEVFIRAIKALGIEDGAAKGDIFYTPQGPVVGEVAARLSGGYMSGWTYPYSSGVDLTEAALNIALGLPPGDLSPKRNWTAAERAFISIPGGLSRISGLEEARGVPGVRDLFLRVAEGSSVKFPENNLEKCGNIISALPDPEEAVAAAEGAVSRIFLRLEPGRKETQDFLFGSSHAAYAAYPEMEKSPDSRSPSPNPGGPILTHLAGFPIAVPPAWNPHERDWNHRSATEALEELSRIYGGDRPGREAPILGRPFWKAFFRGGIQGASWVLDTLAAEKEASARLERIRTWERSDR